MAALTSFISKSVCLVPFPLSAGKCAQVVLGGFISLQCQLGSQRNQCRCKMKKIAEESLKCRAEPCVCSPPCAQRRSCLEAMDWSHSSIASFREAAWAKAQRQGNGEMQPRSSLRRLSLSCAPAAPLVLFSLSVSHFAFSLLFPWCSLHSVIFPVSCHIHFPILFSHPPICVFFLVSFLPSLLSSPSPVRAEQGPVWLWGTRHSCPTLLLHLLTLLLLQRNTVGTSPGKQGEQGWLVAEAKRSSIALRTTVCETGLSA